MAFYSILSLSSRRDDILVVTHDRSGISHGSDDIVLVLENGVSKNSKIKTMSLLRNLVVGLETVSTNMSSLRDLLAIIRPLTEHKKPLVRFKVRKSFRLIKTRKSSSTEKLFQYNKAL